MLAVAAALAAAVPETKPLYAIGPQHRLIEGVATDGRTVWLSSVIDRTILACRKTCRTFVKLPSGDHPLGMAWDSSRQRLWITTDCPPFPGFAKCDNGSVIALDRRGRIKARLAPSGKGFHAGDVSASGGNIFVGEATSGAVYWIRPGKLSLDTLVARGTGRSAQGSALDPSGKRLIVADYGQGVTAVDLETGHRAVLKLEDETIVRGIDGLVRCGQRYVGVFNAREPNELVAFTVDGNTIKVEQRISNPELPAPTQVASSGGRLLIVADGNWDRALKANQAPHGEFPVRWLPLAQLCA
jgi:hypothetical protein